MPANAPLAKGFDVAADLGWLAVRHSEPEQFASLSPDFDLVEGVPGEDHETASSCGVTVPAGSGWLSSGCERPDQLARDQAVTIRA